MVTEVVRPWIYWSSLRKEFLGGTTQLGTREALWNKKLQLEQRSTEGFQGLVWRRVPHYIWKQLSAEAVLSTDGQEFWSTSAAKSWSDCFLGSHGASRRKKKRDGCFIKRLEKGAKESRSFWGKSKLEWVGEIHTFLSPAKNRELGKCKFSCSSCCFCTLIPPKCPKDENNQWPIWEMADHCRGASDGCGRCGFLSCLSYSFPSAPDNRKQSVPDADQWCDSFVSTNTARTLPLHPPSRWINETQDGI